MLSRYVSQLLAPLISLTILMLSAGLFTTLLTIRMQLENVSTWYIGIMQGAYYLGMVLGSFFCERFIQRVGHIRAFAAFAAITTSIALAQGIFVEPTFWMLCRFVAGYCLAGTYIVIESWLLAGATGELRGRILAIYMMALYSGQGLGQLLLDVSDPKTLIPFAVVALLSSLSLVPVTNTYEKSPPLEQPSSLNFIQLYKLSPSGVIGCFVSGLVLGAIYALLPFYIKALQFSLREIGMAMSLTIIGGMLLQYPLGRLSDIYGRRLSVIINTILLILVSLVLVFVYPYKILFFSVLFLFGGFSFTLYPLCISLACDHLQSKDVVAATAGLLLAYGIGAAIGPVLAPAFMKYSGPSGLFVYFISVSVAFVLFLLLRVRVSTPLPIEEQQQYVPVPQTTPIVSELDPRSEENKPETF